jgi:hypothetical protein
MSFSIVWLCEACSLFTRHTFVQVILDSHGEVAARVCSILDSQGHLEADAIAETAMVPAKDTREVRSITVVLRTLAFFSCKNLISSTSTFFVLHIFRFFTNCTVQITSHSLPCNRANNTTQRL